MIDSNIGLRDRVKALFRFILGQVSKAVWGYGEKPGRTILCNFILIIASASIYHGSGLVQLHGVTKTVDWGEALYFSAVTFTTVGYGDFLPLGWVRGVSVFEAF